MKKYFNSKAANIDFRISVPIEVADKAGWYFDDYYEANRQTEWDETSWIVLSKEDYEDAKNRVWEDGVITVNIYGNSNNPGTSFHHGREGYTEDTGDNIQTIEDTIEWLTRGTFIEYKDYSTDANGCYISAFAQFGTMEDEKIGGFLVGKEIIKP